MRYYSDSPGATALDHLPELAPYRAEPDAMYIGCPGKHGYLNLGFELNKEGKSILRELDRRAPLIVQQELYFDEELPQMPCVYILSSGGPNVDGDRYVQNITLRSGAMAHISTGAATKLAEMKRNYSGMTQKIVLEEGAYLEFLPEPIIPCRHTRFACLTDIVCHPSAALVYSEIYMPGRKYHNGEVFEYDVLSVCTRGHRPDGAPLFREKFIIDPCGAPLRLTGRMASYDVFANVIVMAPADAAEKIYAATEAFMRPDLAAGITRLPSGCGVLYKVLGQEPGPVKARVRAFASAVRQAVKGCPLPPEFPWR